MRSYLKYKYISTTKKTRRSSSPDGYRPPSRTRLSPPPRTPQSPPPPAVIAPTPSTRGLSSKPRRNRGPCALAVAVAQLRSCPRRRPLRWPRAQLRAPRKSWPLPLPLCLRPRRHRRPASPRCPARQLPTRVPGAQSLPAPSTSPLGARLQVRPSSFFKFFLACLQVRPSSFFKFFLVRQVSPGAPPGAANPLNSLRLCKTDPFFNL